MLNRPRRRMLQAARLPLARPLPRPRNPLLPRLLRRPALSSDSTRTHREAALLWPELLSTAQVKLPKLLPTSSLRRLPPRTSLSRSSKTRTSPRSVRQPLGPSRLQSHLTDTVLSLASAKPARASQQMRRRQRLLLRQCRHSEDSDPCLQSQHSLRQRHLRLLLRAHRNAQAVLWLQGVHLSCPLPTTRVRPK